jgi:outer membrane immunogenic protein
MKKLALAASILAVSAVSASAADLAARPYTKAPPPMMAAIYDWSGFYLGINGGGAWSHKCWDVAPFTVTPVNNLLIAVPAPFTVAGSEGCHDATGGTVGGQIGYRWQAASWVFGLEAQGNWADLKGSNTSVIPFFAGNSNRSRIDSLGLFTGQVGYAWNTFLLYVKGGAAVTSDKYDGFNTLTGVTFDTARETRWGGVVGVGGEFAFTPNWSFGLEYDHLFMGTRDVSFSSTTPPFAFSRTDRIRQDVDMVTARINYRWGGPVVARY